MPHSARLSLDQNWGIVWFSAFLFPEVRPSCLIAHICAFYRDAGRTPCSRRRCRRSAAGSCSPVRHRCCATARREPRPALVFVIIVEEDDVGALIGTMSTRLDAAQITVELRWETPRGRYDEHNSKSSLNYEIKVIELVWGRKRLQGVANNLEPAQHKLETLPQHTVRLSISLVYWK